MEWLNYIGIFILGTVAGYFFALFEVWVDKKDGEG